jgi:diguanylate cyclase (GGDEF)-like protein
VLDLAARDRDQAARSRDDAAEARVADPIGRPPVDLVEERLLAARDRAAAALDRREAALDRGRAAAYLKKAYRDELTGMLQREAGRDQLEQAVARAHRNGEALVVAFLDVDHLKLVNDEHGHGGGDALLRAVGAALRSGLRSYDIAVRYGGDEFVCALPDLTLSAAGRRFQQISEILAADVSGGAISVGLAQLRPEEAVDALVLRADRAMYRARKRRRVASTAGLRVVRGC